MVIRVQIVLSGILELCCGTDKSTSGGTGVNFNLSCPQKNTTRASIVMVGRGFWRGITVKMSRWEFPFWGLGQVFPVGPGTPRQAVVMAKSHKSMLLQHGSPQKPMWNDSGRSNLHCYLHCFSHRPRIQMHFWNKSGFDVKRSIKFCISQGFICSVCRGYGKSPYSVFFFFFFSVFFLCWTKTFGFVQRKTNTAAFKVCCSWRKEWDVSDFLKTQHLLAQDHQSSVAL